MNEARRAVRIERLEYSHERITRKLEQQPDHLKAPKWKVRLGDIEESLARLRDGLDEVPRGAVVGVHVNVPAGGEG